MGDKKQVILLEKVICNEDGKIYNTCGIETIESKFTGIYEYIKDIEKFNDKLNEMSQMGFTIFGELNIVEKNGEYNFIQKMKYSAEKNTIIILHHLFTHDEYTCVINRFHYLLQFYVYQNYMIYGGINITKISFKNKTLFMIWQLMAKKI